MTIPAYTQHTVRHEAGHLIVTRACGFQTHSIRLTALEAGAELSLEPALRDLNSVRDWLERRIVILYAGAIAESLKGQTIDEQKCSKLLETTAKDDMRKIGELMRPLVGIIHPDPANRDYPQQLKNAVLRLSNISVNTVLANQAVILDLTNLFMRELQKATRENRNRVPDPFSLSEDKIGELLRDKTILPADMSFVPDELKNPTTETST